MSRNPHASALRHFKPKRIEDKRVKSLFADVDKETREALAWLLRDA